MARVSIDANQGFDLYFAPISAASGTTTIVSAHRGKNISVVSYALVATGAGTAKFTDGTDDISGAMSFAANGGIALAGQPSAPLFQTGTSRPVELVTTASFEGHISYTC